MKKGQEGKEVIAENMKVYLLAWHSNSTQIIGLTENPAQLGH
jgi:hypothetical protein